MSTPAPILQYSLAEATVKGLLPSGYTPLAYLESTGTQYIDTGLKTIGTNDKQHVEFALTAIDASKGICGNNNSSSKRFLVGLTTSKYIIIGLGNGYAIIESPDLLKHSIFVDSAILKIYYDGVELSAYSGTYSNSLGNSYNIYLFDTNNYNESSCKIYNYKLWNGNELRLDLRPAKRNSDSVLGMYDLVSNTFMTNSGSGSFIAGPELAIGKDGGKSLPEEYLQVEYVGSTYASGTVYPVYRKSDMLPGTYNTSTSTFTTVSGAIGPTINAEYTWEPNAGSGTLQGLYTNLSGIYDSSKGWVADFATNTSHLSTTITAVGNNFSVAWWELSSNFNNNSMPWGIYPFNPLYSKCLNTCDGGSNPWYKPETTTAINNITNSTWHHFVVTGNGSANYLYVDGVKYGLSKTFKGLTGTSLVINGYQLTTSYCRNPKITNFLIFNVALTDAQVKELYGQ